MDEDSLFREPQTAASAAVIACPTRKVRYARWSSSESSAAVTSGKDSFPLKDLATVKKAADWKVPSGKS